MTDPDRDPGADPVRLLLDIEAIKRLKARYFRALDTKDWDTFGEVFCADAQMEVPEADLVVSGRDAIVEAVSTPLRGTTTVHHGHMPEIEVTGPDSATATWAMEDYLTWPAPDGTSVGIRGYGHYTERYAREGGEWRIAHLHLSRLRVDPA